MKLKLNNYIVLDCETGGLDRKNQEHGRKFAITEVAMIAVRNDNFEELARYESRIKGIKTKDGYKAYHRDLEYDPNALKFTNITIEDLERDGKKHDIVANELYEKFKESNTGSHYNKPIMVGHNITYDIPFIQFLMDLNRLDLSKVLSGYKDHLGVFHPNYFDTMWLSRAKTAEEGSKHTLTTSCQRAGVDLFDAHGAMTDVVATLELFKSYILLLRSTDINVETNVSRFREAFQF